MSGPEAIARRFLSAFSAADFETMRAVLSPDVIAYITGAAGDADPVRGRDPLLTRIEAMDLPAARFGVELTQAPVAVDRDRVLVMVEIRAERGGRELHNFAAHLLRTADGAITEWLMVEAKPAESDAFWAQR